VNRKKRRPKGKDKYARDLEGFIPKYIAATGDQAWTTAKVAAWAIGQRLWEQEKISAIRQLTRELSRVARQVTICDDAGNKISKYHAFRLGHDQPMLWAAMEPITREQMNESKTMRRDTLAAGCIQLANDLDYYNAKHNPGEPLLFDANFTNDLADRAESETYEDAPPPDESPEG
jgi:hypothetical protein